jgi:hypothetical protein
MMNSGSGGTGSSESDLNRHECPADRGSGPTLSSSHDLSPRLGVVLATCLIASTAIGAYVVILALLPRVVDSGLVKHPGAWLFPVLVLGCWVCYRLGQRLRKQRFTNTILKVRFAACVITTILLALATMYFAILSLVPR